MKRLITLSFALLLLAGLVGCRRNKTIQYVRVVEDSAAAAANDIPTEKDLDGYIDDDEGIVTLPDIPQERSVNMQASDYELERMMMGKGTEE